MKRTQKQALRQALVSLAYLGLAIVIVAFTIGLVAYGEGYRYDPLSHRIELSGGLVLLNTAPSGATVKVDGKPTRKKTPYRVTLAAGRYTYEVSKAGYNTWKKQLEVVASGVTFAQYVILFPTQLSPQPLIQTPPVVRWAQSPDRRHVAYITEAIDPGVWVLTGDGRQAVKVYTPKAATADQPVESVSSLTWSDDGSHLLLHTAIGPKVSDVLVQASPGAAPINLTDTFGASLNAVRFDPSNWHQLYFIGADGGLRRISVDNQTVTAVLADKVISFIFGGDRLYYVQTSDLGPAVWALDRGGHKQQVVASLPQSDSYGLAYSNYQGRDILAVLPKVTGAVTVYKDILTNTPTAKLVMRDMTDLTFNDEGRYLIFRTASQFGSYDLDRDELGPVNQISGTLNYFGWFDGYHLLINTDQGLSMVEYDGGYPQQIDAHAAAGPAFGTQDGKKLWWLSPVGTPPQNQIQFIDLKK